MTSPRRENSLEGLRETGHGEVEGTSAIRDGRDLLRSE